MGPTGPQGLQGDVGPSGPQGPKGDIGPGGGQAWSSFLVGFSSAYIGSTFTPDNSITVTRVQATLVVPAGVKCNTYPVIDVTDGIADIPLTLNVAVRDSGPIAMKFAAGAALAVRVIVPADCPTAFLPSFANVIVQYHAQ
jgi:hypothetical protein